MTFFLIVPQEDVALLAVDTRVVCFDDRSFWDDGPPKLRRLRGGLMVGTGLVRWLALVEAAVAPYRASDVDSIGAAIRGVMQGDAIERLRTERGFANALESNAGRFGELEILYRNGAAFAAASFDDQGNCRRIPAGSVLHSPVRGLDVVTVARLLKGMVARWPQKADTADRCAMIRLAAAFLAELNGLAVAPNGPSDRIEVAVLGKTPPLLLHIPPTQCAAIGEASDVELLTYSEN
ncbi:MAG TPA: hypothetical protein VLV45_03365 [Gemmatimonadales bacterium]|nr:hypothetical protein [Gemmatimonadales bacterium]